MKAGGGHAKGSAFERKIAKQIVAAFKQHGIEQRDCWRSVLSGGHMISCGDLAVSDRLLQLFPWAVECKFRRRIRWERFLLDPKYRKKTWEESKWLVQAIEGAKKRKGLVPLLVVKENHGPVYALWETERVGEWVMHPFDDFLRDTVKAARRIE